jgi:hypothetical protein
MKKQTFKVRIVKATHDTYWYAHHIGETFTVKTYHHPDQYQRVDQPYRLIMKQDAEVIKS